MDGTIGEVRMFAGDFAPVQWKLCNGQLLAISEYDVLYTLLGTTFGGDGQNTFALPALGSRVPIGTGQGAGLSNITLGNTGGTEANTLTINTMAAHSHPLTGAAGILVSGEDGRKASPVNNSPAVNGEMIYSSVTDGTVMAPASINLSAGAAGSQAPAAIPNVKPVLAINFIICYEGIYPSQP